MAGDIVFLHRLVPGAASRSYGVAVAKLAGLPEVVLARAKALLLSLEGEAGQVQGKPLPHKNDDQLSLFGARPSASPQHTEVLELLRALEIDRLTGLEALQLLARLKSKL
jgi:DNA mismatch repair protein MutS